MVEQTGLFNIGMATNLGERKLWIQNLLKVAHMLDCDIVVSELQLRYVHFRTYTLGTGMNPLIPPAMV